MRIERREGDRGLSADDEREADPVYERRRQLPDEHGDEASSIVSRYRCRVLNELVDAPEHAKQRELFESGGSGELTRTADVAMTIRSP